ncbi:MAG: hypothetical protein ABFD76_17170 [Smithella sp.]
MVNTDKQHQYQKPIEVFTRRAILLPAMLEGGMKRGIIGGDAQGGLRRKINYFAE